MKRSVSILVILLCSILVFSVPSFAAVGNNIDNDFESGWIDGWFLGGEGHGFSIVEDPLIAGNHELKSNSNSAYNAIYFGEYADNIVFQFDYKPNTTGETWGGASIFCGPNGRYDIGLNNGTTHQSRVRIWRAGAEVAYNIHDIVGKGVPALEPQKWSTVKIALQGGRIRVFVNDMLTIDYTDAQPFTEGGFGLRAANADVSYDNIKFYPVSELTTAPMTGYSDDFSTDKMIQESPYNTTPYMDPEGNPFEITDGALVSPDADNYNAIYFGAAQESAVMEFDFKDFGEGAHSGGVSLNTWTLNGGSRYDVAISSNSVGDKKVVIYKGGEEVADNTDATTGKYIPNIPENVWVNCKVVQDGGNIKVYVKDHLCVDYTDSEPLTGGYYGFRAAGSLVGYDNLKFYDIDSLVLSPVSESSESSSSTSSSSTGNSSTTSSSTASSDGGSNPVTGDRSGFGAPLAAMLILAGGAALVIKNRKQTGSAK